ISSILWDRKPVQLSSRHGIPDSDSPIQPCRNSLEPVGRELRVENGPAMAREFEQRAEGFCVPQLHLPIGSAREDRLAIGRENCARSSIVIPSEGRNFVVSRSVPYSKRPVFAGGYG